MGKVVNETDEFVTVESTSEDWPDAAGSVRSLVTEWKEGHAPDGGVTPEDRVATLEAKVAAAGALAEKANATAQEVAQAMKNAAPGQTR